MKATLDALWSAVDGCMLADQHRLRRRIKDLQRTVHAGKSVEAAVATLQLEIDTSNARRHTREQARPAVNIVEDLPIGERWREIAAAIEAHQVVVVAGETGSGKTTQLPKICLALGRGVAGMIGHTQPRRIAARSVAVRIAEELSSPLGEVVGYKVRFSDHTHPSAYIKLMTDGILLAELQHDRYLNQYDTLIIDEAHERSLNIDFMLGYLKRLLPQRPDLKVIITSATIDVERFSRHFHNAPIIEVSGRMYPVEVRYRPLLGDEDEQDQDMETAVLAAVDEVSQLDARGDVLVFLSGEREIRDLAEALRKHHPMHTEILPLFSRQSAAEQNRVFQPGGRRRIILATNVAETSLTVPGIRYVIDTGYARISRYSYRSKVQRLPVEKIAQSSANQRAGRCGRVSAGVCIRLYSEEDFAARPAYTEPEIQRTNLAAVILQMRQLGLGNPDEFPFVDAPDRRFISDGFRLLQELAAIDERHELTPLGKQLAQLPVDPRIGRMILESQRNNCLREVLVIAAALSIQDPRERPADKQQQADEAHARFRDEDSDFATLLKLWAELEEQRKHSSKNQLRKHCQKNFLSYTRVREWHETHKQLQMLAKELDLRTNEADAGYAEIHRALLSGLLGNIGTRAEVEEKPGQGKAVKGPPRYLGTRNMEFYLFPGSGTAKKRHKWVMAAEIVETARLYARNVARIEPEWVEPLAAHLIKRSYSEPHWDQKSAKVSAYETVSLYGLILQARRRVNYGPIDPAMSREIFIREAMVAGRYHTRAKYFLHNRALLDEAHELESMTRRRDVLADDETLFAFFAARIPGSIHDGASFEKWREQAEKKDPQLLYLQREDVLRKDDVSSQAYPGEMETAGVRIRLSYGFNPGGEDDGVTATIPLGALNQLQPEPFEWLVPGLLQEKIAALLKALPKSARKQLVPIPDYAARLMAALEMQSDKQLGAAIGRQLNVMENIDIVADAWDETALPDHLRMRFRVLDSQGKTVSSGRDLRALQAEFGQHAATDFHDTLQTGEWSKAGITQWDFGDLPEFVELKRGGSVYRAYPALVDCGESVAIKLFDTPRQASEQHRQGLRRLVTLCLPKPIKSLRQHIKGIKNLCLQYAVVGDCDELNESLLMVIVDRCFFPDGVDVRRQAEFEALLSRQQAQLMGTANAVCELTASILSEYHHAKTRIKAGAMKAVADIEEQVASLVFPRFLRETPYEWLQHLPRFLKAIGQRLDKLKLDAVGDRERWNKIQPYITRLGDYRKKTKAATQEMESLRWMLEEYRVSLFAQGLKTSVPVSPKRLDELFAKLKV
jgi:ATP-dependent helicase HrpA